MRRVRQMTSPRHACGAARWPARHNHASREQSPFSMVVYVNIHNHDSMSSVDRIEQLQALARFPSRAKANELAVEVAAEHDLSPAALVDLMLAVQGDTRRATALNGALAASDLFLAGSIAKGVGKGAFYIAKNAAKNPYDWNRYSYKAAVQCGGEIRVRNAHLV